MDEQSPDSLQNVYAKNLQQSFGYPLRFPEPKPSLPPSYAQDGLHIGDVGYVDDEGMFEVLFNICFSPDHELHYARRNDLAGLVGLTQFDLNKAPRIPGVSAGRAICHGAEGPQGDNLKQTQGVPSEFKSCSASGAILILPSGAVRQNLDKRLEEEFRKLAEKCALDWCQFAGCRSLYLITGFYKTCSWYLASFHNVKPTGRTLLQRDSAGRYTWDSHCDYRQSPEENRNENQAVFVSGFKIEVRGWDRHTRALVEKMSLHPRSIWSELMFRASFLLSILMGLWDRDARKDVDAGVHVNRVPALSPPFHPSDIINRYLLDKNPNDQVAITHDNVWLSMLEKNELSHEDMVHEGRFWAFLEENYTNEHNSDNVVYLRRKTEECNKLRDSTLSPKIFSLPTAPNDTRQIVITRIRVENVVIRLRRMPVGFYALVQFDGTKRRSRCKPASLRESIIEWDDEIILPTDSTVNVQFSIVASFEFEPMLGDGETLCISETSVGNLAEGESTYALFSSESGTETSSPLSVLITVEEWRSNPSVYLGNDNSHLGSEDGSCNEAEVTDKGHNALLRFHRGEGIEMLKECVECFEHALDLCPSEHKCRAAALFNHATASFINAQVRGTIPNLNVAISSYRKVLELRPGHHPDRPGTLLHLAEALLYRQGRLQCEAPVTDEIEELAMEIKEICSESSYECRAANLILQTLKRYRILKSGKLAEVNELVSELDRSARMPPDWHFDRPYRLINFSAALRKRFEITGNLDDLEGSISEMEKATCLIPPGYLDKPWMLASLGDALCVRFVQRGDVADLNSSISMTEEALKPVPDGHFGKPRMLACLGNALRVRFAQRGDVTDLDRSISIIEDAVKLTPDGYFDKPWMCASLGDALCVRFVRCGDGDITNLDKSISMMEDAVELAPDGHVEKPWMLARLGVALLVRFTRGKVSDFSKSISMTGSSMYLTPTAHLDLNRVDDIARLSTSDLSDLEQVISRHRDAVKLLPDGNPYKANCLSILASSLFIRFWGLGRQIDLEEAVLRCQDAIKLIPDRHVDKPESLNNLAVSLRTRFKHLNELRDLEEAISRHKDAIKLIPADHRDRPRYLKNYRFSLETRLVYLRKLGKLELLREVCNN